MFINFAFFRHTEHTLLGPALYKFWDQMPPCMLIEPIVESVD